MKFVISKDGVKRWIETPFALCIDTEHFGSLIKSMQAAHAGMVANGTTYGWVRVDTDHPDLDSAPNTAPRAWAE